MLPFRFLPEAIEEFDEAFAWYDERNPAKAEEFAEAIDQAIARIRRAPTMYARLDRFRRSCRVLIYPYSIVYRIFPDRIQIVAVAHAKRRFGYWKSREA